MIAVEENAQTRLVSLGELVQAVGPLAATALDVPARALAIRGIAVDSRAVSGGEVFVAVRGAVSDGHDFVRAAVDRGAVAVVVERDVPSPGVPLVRVESSAKALALMASRYFGDPGRDLALCGVTGTNGKTSTAWLVRSIMRQAGRKLGVVGTLGHGVDTLVRDAHTTPDAVTLHSWLRTMRDQHCFGVVMEVSSHAVRQHRTWGLDFNVGILTNVTHDHLDFHKSMDDYKAAKAEFCYSLAAAGRRKPAGVLVYWVDDPVARAIGDAHAGARVAVGTSPEANWRVHDVDATLDGTHFVLTTPGGERVPVRMQLLGGFVPANAAVAAAGAVAMGAGLDAVRAGLEALDRVPGRFEALGGGDRPVVVVDYAHTPDGFERVLASCLALRPRRLVTVFGCGGDRDRSKRPLMGAIAQRASDRCYVTTDNPRTERVETIVADILAGTKGPGNVVVELDRARAIHAAVAECAGGDLVALLGKGHEDYQILGTEKLPFSDREQAEEALARWRAP
jgi:UDP-N-acetylmuramoyl-L-alanyl-D-glutamate--2,6-diaminopimelate ligase